MGQDAEGDQFSLLNSLRAKNMPVFTSGVAHWLLAHVQTKMRTITIYNSLRGFGQTEWLKPFRESFLPSLLPTAAKGKPFDIVYANIPQQQNGHDCGIFVMAWLFHLYVGAPSRMEKKRFNNDICHNGENLSPVQSSRIINPSTGINRAVSTRKIKLKL